MESLIQDSDFLILVLLGIKRISNLEIEKDKLMLCALLFVCTV